ncbi:MAG TPA: hypothetical protein VF916_02375 [Ktedonobacterales bacterium]
MDKREDGWWARNRRRSAQRWFLSICYRNPVVAINDACGSDLYDEVIGPGALDE